MDKYLEVLGEIEAHFGSQWKFPAAEAVLKLVRREHRDGTLTRTQFDEIQVKALKLMRPFLESQYADKPAPSNAQ